MRYCVSFDFDSTLDRVHIQEYASELIVKNEVDVWIVTSRYDDENFIRTHGTNTRFGVLANKDLFDIATKLGIPNERIVFTNMSDKWTFFKDKPEFIWHLDDDFFEIRQILNKTKVLAVNGYDNSAWKNKCNRFIHRKIKNDLKGMC